MPMSNQYLKTRHGHDTRGIVSIHQAYVSLLKAFRDVSYHARSAPYDSRMGHLPPNYSHNSYWFSCAITDMEEAYAYAFSRRRKP